MSNAWNADMADTMCLGDSVTFKTFVFIKYDSYTDIPYGAYYA